MKIGGFKTGHCYHKPSDAAIQKEPIQITVLSLSLVILLEFTWDFKMEETTHDSSSRRNVHLLVELR